MGLKTYYHPDKSFIKAIDEAIDLYEKNILYWPTRTYEMFEEYKVKVLSQLMLPKGKTIPKKDLRC